MSDTPRTDARAFEREAEEWRKLSVQIITRVMDEMIDAYLGAGVQQAALVAARAKLLEEMGEKR